MSNFKGHLIAGTATGIITGGTAWYITKNPIAGLVFAGVTIAGSLAPDIDVGSIPSRIFAWIGIALSALMIYNGRPTIGAYIGIAYMAFSSDKHRGITHKWILPAACFIAGWYGYVTQNSNYLMLVPFGVGLIVHLCLDKIPPYKII